MKKYAQLQYQGLNLFDEIGTVEIAIDCENRTVHVYDTQQIVAPEYHFMSKSYQLTDSFYKMAAIIRTKNFLVVEEGLSTEQWVKNNKWYFYSQLPHIKRYVGEAITLEDYNSSNWTAHFYQQYVNKYV